MTERRTDDLLTDHPPHLPGRLRRGPGAGRAGRLRRSRHQPPTVRAHPAHRPAGRRVRETTRRLGHHRHPPALRRTPRDLPPGSGPDHLGIQRRPQRAAAARPDRGPAQGQRRQRPARGRERALARAGPAQRRRRSPGGDPGPHRRRRTLYVRLPAVPSGHVLVPLPLRHPARTRPVRGPDRRGPQRAPQLRPGMGRDPGRLARRDHRNTVKSLEVV